MLFLYNEYKALKHLTDHIDENIIEPDFLRFPFSLGHKSKILHESITLKTSTKEHDESHEA